MKKESKAKIIKVSGPLVVAEGMEKAKMYDMVRVGKMGLIGEIIEIKEDKASIQVYEETSGLGPGEPVETTLAPLSVELGPGLMSGIYDGIQRPLDIIRDKTGSYITRGITLPAVNRKKKWDFVPLVKKGDRVRTGDVLGTIQETPLVIHKVLVPPGIEGKIKVIKKGKFTVAQTIATIKTSSGIKEIKMLQKWPIRRERMVQKKLPPEVPLVTGQRVIDTFFPVAKGGTACIPGPFGSGKCVSGDTPVLLNDGDIKPIRELYKEHLTKGRIEKNGEETIIYHNPPLSVFSMSKEGLRKSFSSLFYKGGSNSLISIKTRTGRKVEVTPIHKLFRITNQGEICQTPAKDLKKGDFILSVRKIKVSNSNQKIDIYKLKDVRVRDESIREEISQILRRFRKEKKLSRLKISLPVIKSLIEKENSPTLEVVKQIYQAVNSPLPQPQKLSLPRSKEVIRIPDSVTPDMAEFLGLFVAEGYIRSKGTAVFTGTDPELLTRFTQLATSLFGVKARLKKWGHKAPNIEIYNRVLVKFLKMLEFGGVSDTKTVPKLVLKSSDQAVASFLKGYYLGDGSFSDGEIELTTASRRLQNELSYLLLRFGILHSLTTRWIKDKEYYRIFIRGKENLKRFLDLIKEEKNFEKIQRIFYYLKSKKTFYTAIDIVPLLPWVFEKLYRSSGMNYSTLKRAGIEIFNYTTNQEKMSTKMFSKFVQVLTTEEKYYPRLIQLAKLLKDFYCDEIISIEEVKGAVDVFDLSVPGRENFVGGFGGIILHNTVILHCIAAWADADIILYVGCGERGNEMTDVLLEFPRLKDPKTGRPLIERTIMIANTSNMPVAAREASIYTGITIAEYYRDMGYNVAVMADSTSRWAEALREISGRLEEMPGEEGYPAYLGTRLAEFYERAGRVICQGTKNREGTLSVMGAVSPPGGDLSDPVVQATLRTVKVFWALEDRLAYMRHFPAINWLNSYSLYLDNVETYLGKEVASDWMKLRNIAMSILQEEDSLQEIVRLVGKEALSSREQLVLETAKSIREDYLMQNAFHEVDVYAPLEKQYRMLKVILELHRSSKHALEKEIPLEKLLTLKVKERIARMKYIEKKNMKEFETIEKEIKKEIDNLTAK
jgi:V/A-type H+-transporting ATPase subunit A